jgi:hypothetical protein
VNKGLLFDLDQKGEVTSEYYVLIAILQKE